VVQALPQDLEESARAHRALQRAREVKRAVDLLRLALAYAVCAWPLRLLGAWFMLMDLGNLSDVAVLKRLRRCSPWLGWPIVAWLQARRLALSQRPGVRLRLVDATAVSRPGSQGTDWRVHLSLDLGNLCLDGIEVTDAHGGETLARFAARPGEVLVADRGLAFASGMGAILASRAGLLVRINWQNLPLTTQEGQRLDLIRWLQQVDRPCERPVGLCTPQGSFRLRLMACPIAAQAAASGARLSDPGRCLLRLSWPAYALRRPLCYDGPPPGRREGPAAWLVRLVFHYPDAERTAHLIRPCFRVLTMGSIPDSKARLIAEGGSRRAILRPRCTDHRFTLA